MVNKWMKIVWVVMVPVVPMVREQRKWWSHERESTDAGRRGGQDCRSN